jgi:hypothetical protein
VPGLIYSYESVIREKITCVREIMCKEFRQKVPVFNPIAFLARQALSSALPASPTALLLQYLGGQNTSVRAR